MEVSKSSHPENKTLTFPGSYESLAAIGTFVRNSALAAGLDDFAAYSVETAVDEACSNIIDHAYAGLPQGTIDCTCQVVPEGLLVILHDHGKAFNPDEVFAPDLNASLDDRLAHGLGLHFIRQWMDEVHFEFSEKDGNRLTMLKRKVSGKKESAKG